MNELIHARLTISKEQIRSLISLHRQSGKAPAMPAKSRRMSLGALGAKADRSSGPAETGWSVVGSIRRVKNESMEVPASLRSSHP